MCGKGVIFDALLANIKSQEVARKTGVVPAVTFGKTSRQC
jgi:hypothetical protein